MPHELDLTDPAIRQFAELGYVLFPDVLDADLIAEASAHVGWLQSATPASGRNILAIRT